MNRTEIQQDWPTDPQNDELARLAEQLQASAAPLSSEALGRVQQQMQTELDAAERRIRIRRVAFGWSIAAAVLLALSGYAYFSVGRDRAAPAPMARNKDTPAPVLIDDRITIALGESSVTTGDKALVRLDENRSLFTD